MRERGEMIFPLRVKFGLRGLMFGLKVFFRENEGFLEKVAVEVTSMMKAVL